MRSDEDRFDKGHSLAGIPRENGFEARAPITAACDVTVRFKRPVFWDDAIAIWGKRGGDGTLTAVLAVNGDGKRVAECAVADVTYQTA